MVAAHRRLALEVHVARGRPAAGHGEQPAPVAGRRSGVRPEHGRAPRPARSAPSSGRRPPPRDPSTIPRMPTTSSSPPRGCTTHLDGVRVLDVRGEVLRGAALPRLPRPLPRGPHPRRGLRRLAPRLHRPRRPRARELAPPAVFAADATRLGIGDDRWWSPTTTTETRSPAGSCGCCAATATAPPTCSTAASRLGRGRAAARAGRRARRRRPTRPTARPRRGHGLIDLAAVRGALGRRRASRSTPAPTAEYTGAETPRPPRRPHPGRASTCPTPTCWRRRPVPRAGRAAPAGCRGRGRPRPARGRLLQRRRLGHRGRERRRARRRARPRRLRRLLERVGQPRRHPGRRRLTRPACPVACSAAARAECVSSPLRRVSQAA